MDRQNKWFLHVTLQRQESQNLYTYDEESFIDWPESTWNLVIDTIDAQIFPLLSNKNRLFQRNKSGAVCGTDTGSAVLHRFVRDAELSQVMANHLGLQNKNIT